MAKRNSGRRGRARRRGTHPAPVASQPAEGGQATTAKAAQPRARPKRAESGATKVPGYRDPGGVGERPQAPWHPWPLSELLILVGAIATLIGFLGGAARRPVLFAGLGAVILGTIEFTIREHLAGYRAHSSLLAAIPTAIAYSAIAVTLYSLGTPRAAWIIVPLVVGVPLFWFLFRNLRARFDDARRQRVFELSRR